MTPHDQGIDDARTFANEFPSQVSGALAPGQPDADEILLSALGIEATAKLLGVEPGADDFAKACKEYSEAFKTELRSIQEEG